MALSPINAICTKCGSEFTQIPKIIFLGFQQVSCSNCASDVIYPLTSGRRFIYWFIFLTMVIYFIELNGEATLGGLGVAIIMTILRDLCIRKRVSSPNIPQSYFLHKFEKMMSSFFVFLVLLTISVIAGKAGEYVDDIPSLSNMTNGKVNLVESLKKASIKQNEKGSFMIDKETRFERTEVDSDARIIYFYYLPNYSSKKITLNWIDSNIKPETIKSVCAGEKTRPILKMGAIYAYSYTGNDGVEISRFEVRNDDCN